MSRPKISLQFFHFHSKPQSLLQRRKTVRRITSAPDLLRYGKNSVRFSFSEMGREGD